MTPDFPTYLLATALLSGALGFFLCGILCARQIRRAELEGWKECSRFYAERERREHALKNGAHR